MTEMLCHHDPALAGEAISTSKLIDEIASSQAPHDDSENNNI
jgi:hypothetical protein